MLIPDSLARWAVIPASGPVCSEDIVRVMKCLLPVLNISLHVRNGTENTKLNVEGPLTWRQFHHMAGVVTKVCISSARTSYSEGPFVYG